MRGVLGPTTVLCGLAAALLLSPATGRAGGAQPGEKAPPSGLSLRIAYDPKAPPKDLERIVLRPNPALDQPVFLHLHNAGEIVRKGVKVAVVPLAPDGTPGRPFLLGAVPIIPPGQTRLIPFAPPAPPQDVKDPKATAPVLSLIGPPFAFQVVVEDGKLVERFRVPVLIEEPRLYLQVAKINFDPARRRLSATVRATDGGREPGAPLQLVLDPRVIPGLIPTKIGTTRAAVDRQNPEAELFAESIRFEEGVRPRSGRVYLTADGYERAFIYAGMFAAGEPQPLGIENPRVRVIMPRYYQPKKSIPVPLQVDGLLNAGYRVEVAFDRSGNGRFVPVQLLPGTRQQTVQLTAAEAGNLLFKAGVRDWLVDLDTAGVVGRRLLRVRVIDPDGNVVPLANEQDLQEETLSLFDKAPGNRYAPLTFNAAENALFAEILIDAEPPVVQLLNLPKAVAPKGELMPHARVARTPDQGPVGRVVFWLGDPLKPEAPLPKGVVEGRFDGNRLVWVPEVALVVPPDLKDRVLVNARAFTLSEYTADRGVAVPIVIPPPPPPPSKEPPKIKLAVITGTITRGGRPQPQTLVLLRDDRGAVKASAKTSDVGVYKFEEVIPGTYQVVAEQPALRTLGSTTLTVPVGPGKTYDKIDIGLKVQPQLP